MWLEVVTPSFESDARRNMSFVEIALNTVATTTRISLHSNEVRVNYEGIGIVAVLKERKPVSRGGDHKFKVKRNYQQARDINMLFLLSRVMSWKSDKDDRTGSHSGNTVAIAMIFVTVASLLNLAIILIDSDVLPCTKTLTG